MTQYAYRQKINWKKIRFEVFRGGTWIIALGRVEEEAEESTLAHSYACVEQQAGEVLLGQVMSGSNRKRQGKSTAWLWFVHSLQTMQCGIRYDCLSMPQHTCKKEGGLPQAMPCASLHETNQIGLNMFGFWVVDSNKLLLINLTADKSPDLHTTFPRGILRSPVSFTAIPWWQPRMTRPSWPSSICSVKVDFLRIQWNRL